MELKIALAAKNPFALLRARDAFLETHKGEAHVWGHGECCGISMADGTAVRLMSESDYLRGTLHREALDQVFTVGPEPLSVAFQLFLQECLIGSQVPEEWQWQKWNGGGENAQS